MAFLSKEQFLSKGKAHRSVKVIALPELGGDVGIKCLPVSERKRFRQDLKALEEAAKKEENDNDPLVFALLTYCLCGEDGKPFLTEADAATLADLDWKVTQRIVEEILEWNGLGEKAQEQAEKNSERTPSDNGLPPRAGATV